jgi:hypothetical protein
MTDAPRRVNRHPQKIRPMLAGMPLRRKSLRVPLWRYLCIFYNTTSPSNDNSYPWWKQV